MAKEKDKDVNVIPNALGLMYFEERTNSKITIDVAVPRDVGIYNSAKQVFKKTDRANFSH